MDPIPAPCPAGPVPPCAAAKPRDRNSKRSAIVDHACMREGPGACGPGWSSGPAAWGRRPTTRVSFAAVAVRTTEAGSTAPLAATLGQVLQS